VRLRALRNTYRSRRPSPSDGGARVALAGAEPLLHAGNDARREKSRAQLIDELGALLGGQRRDLLGERDGDLVLLCR